MIKNIIFDLGNVLIDWNPRYVYSKIFLHEPEEMEFFLTHVCSSSWNSELDSGKPFDIAVLELQTKFPQYKREIQAYKDQWHDMIKGSINESVELLKDLKSNGLKCFALSNWSQETFETTRNKFEFFKLFDGMVVSGYENLIKPDSRIYKLLLTRFHLNPKECLFIDDLEKNIIAACEQDIQGIVFKSPADLREKLRTLNLLHA